MAASGPQWRRLGQRNVLIARTAAIDALTTTQRAEDALARFAAAQSSIEDPLLAVALTRGAGAPSDPRRLAQWLSDRQPHYGRDNAMRYRWGLSWRSEPGHEIYRRAEGARRLSWRPAEAERLRSDPTAYGRRFMEPIVLAVQLRFWGDLAANDADPELAATAAGFLEEALPVMEHDVASWFAALDPWRDTFGLWLLTAEPQAVARLRDLLFSVAVRYGGIAARDGAVLGLRHPYHRRPLVSASAHLAVSLWRMSVYPSVIPSLLELIRGSTTPEGAWADGDQPPDLLTTLAAADALARLDPSFDPALTTAWFVQQQEQEGWWRALDPEVPWLTASILDWIALAALPFAERFSWPSAPIWARDRLTGLTTVATLDELGHVLEGMPSLGALDIEAAFLDLADFGKWNNTHGQSRGDELMGVLGASLRGLSETLAVRLGGDEFLILGKPGAVGLEAAIDDWRSRWPATVAVAGLPGSVAPRVVIGTSRSGQLRELRRRLGEAIGRLKEECPSPGPTGVARRL
jgi:hypothetical protein